MTPNTSSEPTSEPSSYVFDIVEEEPSPEPEPRVVPSDPAIMSKMSCAPVDPALIERIKKDFGNPKRTVQVKVGEGLDPDEIWWVVVFDLPPFESFKGGFRAFLTTAPGLPADGKWISLRGKDTWRSVDWDDEKLVRGQSALSKGYECLEN
ncbi:hypothetical protein [Timonella sp. A28]|uniref:hypothetical protein n=1 Tax=Timonella sp. A28 TaxID=3442640 RepID=UPI003EC05379